MCGICGVVFKRDSIANQDDLILKMMHSMSHRGPDGEGHYRFKNISLGHKRLSIIDLSSAGTQPMHDDTGELCVVFNGEIYNYQAIKADLQLNGAKFKSESDTEVLLKAYQHYGKDCLDHFNGMFAFAIYDKTNNTLFLARDRLGEKPLYYYNTEDYFIFASEIKAIISSGLYQPDVDVDLLDFYVSLGYVPGTNTLFSSIKKIPPGHYGLLSPKEFKLQSYWDIDLSKYNGIAYPEAKEELTRILQDSVRLRLISDVPTGVFLSGGVDSATIVATITKGLGHKVDTFSVGYSDDPHLSELENAKKIATKFETVHHEFILSHLNFFESIDALLEHCEEPLLESAAIALMQLSFQAKNTATVLLSGEGADEVFAGYPLYQIMSKINLLQHFIPGRFTKKIAPYLKSEKFIKYTDWLATPIADRYQGISNDVTPSIKNHMYSNKLNFSAGNKVGNYFHGQFAHFSEASLLQRMQYADIKTWLPDDLLLKADKMTMAASIELRVPFLDYRMVEFGLALPDEYKIKKGQGKYILKDAMRGYLPDEILFQKKKGFPVPIARWFRGELQDKVKMILLDKKTIERGYFQKNYIEKVIERHSSGAQDLSRRILGLLVLELWHRKYIDSKCYRNI